MTSADHHLVSHFRFPAAALLVTVVLVGCSALGAPASRQAPEPTATAMMNADYPFYESLGDLAAEADLVVTVRIGDSRYDVSRPLRSSETNPALNPQAGVDPSQEEQGFPITVYDAMVVGAHRGQASAGDAIEIARTGGVLNGIAYGSNEARLESGGSYLLFLSSLPGRPAYVLGGDQGVLVPDGKRGFTSIAGDRLSIDSVSLATLR